MTRKRSLWSEPGQKYDKALDTSDNTNVNGKPAKYIYTPCETDGCRGDTT